MFAAAGNISKKVVERRSRIFMTNKLPAVLALGF